MYIAERCQDDIDDIHRIFSGEMPFGRIAIVIPKSLPAIDQCLVRALAEHNYGNGIEFAELDE